MAAPSTTVDGETTAVATPSPNAGIGGDEATAKVRAAPSPFDNAYGDADVVLRTADGADFYVHKNILRMSSTFFNTMFSIPQPETHARSPSNEGPVLNSSTALEVLPVPEDSRALESVLRWCYPKAIHNPASSTVAQISLALAAAQLYGMEHVVTKLTKKLRTLRHHRPLEVFAEAFYRDLKDIALDAADSFCYPSLPPTYEKRKQMPMHPISTYSPHMDGVPASWYFRLLEHHHRVAVIPNPHIATIPHFRLPSRSLIVTEHGLIGKQRSSPVLPLHPFHDDPRADVLVRSSDGSRFFVWSSLLSYSSPVLDQMLSTVTVAPDAATTDTTPDRQLDLPEDGQTLALLIKLCYPMPDPELVHGSNEEKLADLNRLLDAARKYKVTRAVDFVRQKFIAIADVSPVRLYFIASQQGWEYGLQEAAVRCIYEEADEYVPEMELGTAAAYRRLLVYRQRCREIILACYDPTPVPSPWPRPNRAKYFSKQSWLSEPRDSRFWLAIHRRVRENVCAARDPIFDLEALYPSFGRTEPLTQGTTNHGNKTLSLQDLVETGRALGEVRKLA